ncbi:MAG: hypothetical protein L0229_02840 [Blastocatellia bacterium]|nr:hypothetical protein [Blastocatellia bacterium]
MRTLKLFLILALTLPSSTVLAVQNNSAQNKQQLSVEEIIQRFATAESENKAARNNYTFTQDVDIMTLGEAGSITGRFRRTSEIVYDDIGNRVEKITFFPPSTLSGATISQDDLRDLGGVQPFALSLEDLPRYQVDYVGKERIDELDLYVFEVKPKRIEKGERYFQGRVWVDDQDFQIVKAAGKGVPEDEDNRFPGFESYRENIDGRYWFPTYVYADDILEFKRSSIHVRMIVRYTKYKKFSTDIRLLDEGEVADEEDVKSAEKNKKPEGEKDKKPGESNPPPPKKPVRKP